MLVRIYKILFFLVPIPIFVDFGNASLILHDIRDYNYILDRPEIPFPIGALAFFLSLIIGYTCSAINPTRFKSVLPPAKLVIFITCVLIPICLYAAIISELSPTRIIQITLPIIFLSILSFPRSAIDRMEILKYTMLGSGAFFYLHFISLISTSTNIFSVDDLTEYSSMFGLLIYPALVSYPGVLSLYLFTCLAIIYSAKQRNSPITFGARYIYGLLPLILLYLLAASGRRAALVELASGALIIVLMLFLFSVSKGSILKRTFFYSVIFIVASSLFILLYLNTPLSSRVLMSVKENTFDSGRIDILNMAYEFFAKNPSIFFWGAGGSEAPGLHNYFLDQLYRVGIFGLIFIYLTTVVLVKKFIKTTDRGATQKNGRTTFILIITSCAFWQSMINASISQPYYFINLLLVSILVYFVIFTPRDEENNIKPNDRKQGRIGNFGI